MKSNIYLKLIILLVVILIIYKIFLINSFTIEGFTPRIRQMYRPYLRHMHLQIETFKNNYNMTTFINKLRKWNIY